MSYNLIEQYTVRYSQRRIKVLIFLLLFVQIFVMRQERLRQYRTDAMPQQCSSGIDIIDFFVSSLCGRS